MKALLLISHGSRTEESVSEVQNLLTAIKTKTKFPIGVCAYLDVRKPTIEEAIQKYVEEGASEVYALMHFVVSGRHVTQHVAQIIDEARQKHPNVKFFVTPPIGLHPKISDLFVDFIREVKP